MSLLTGLISYWKFDTNNSTQPDSHGSNDGTVTGATYTSSGKIGGAYSYNGTSDFIDCGNDSSLDLTGDYSISGWFKGHNASSNEIIVSRYNNGTNRGFALRFTSDEKVQLFHTVQGTDEGGLLYNECISSSSYTSDWHHFIATFEVGVGSKLYIDGSLVDSDSTRTDAISAYTQNLFIGKQAGTPLYYNDDFDECGIWSKVLSTNERTKLYNSGNGLTYPFTTNSIFLASNF